MRKRYLCVIYIILNIINLTNLDQAAALPNQNIDPGYACVGTRDYDNNSRIVNGEDAAIDHWPGLVALRFKNPNKPGSVYACVGTLIASRWVLTAAHCFDNVQKSGTGKYYFWNEKYRKLNNWNLEVVYGKQDLKDFVRKDSRQIKNIIIHPRYKKNNAKRGNDIALVNLKGSFRGPFMRIATHNSFNPPNLDNIADTAKLVDYSRVLMVAGYGLLKPRSQGGRLQNYTTNIGRVPFQAGSSKLQEVAVPIVPIDVCREIYQAKKCNTWGRCFKDAIINREQICAGYDFGKKDACKGDSGGPLVTFDEKKCPIQIGLTSWGDSCAKRQSYGVYTRVSEYYLNFIRKHVGNIESLDKRDIVPIQGARQFKLTGAANKIRETLKFAERADRLSLSISSGSNLGEGEIFAIDVESTVNGQLILIDINPHGKITQILPNDLFVEKDQGMILKNRKIEIGSFCAKEPYGRGHILALVVPRTFLTTQEVSRDIIPVNEKLLPTNYILNLALRVEQASQESSKDEWALNVMEYNISASGKFCP